MRVSAWPIGESFGYISLWFESVKDVHVLGPVSTEMEKQTDVWRYFQGRFKESSEEFSRNQWPRNRGHCLLGRFHTWVLFNDPPLGCFGSLFNLLVGMQVRFYTLPLAVPLRFFSHCFNLAPNHAVFEFHCKH